MALITDLKRRGMLDDTLVVWAGEFGRTPMSRRHGRDHHNKGFSIWLAGGGIKGGMSTAPPTSSATAVENVVTVHDLHATMLHGWASTTTLHLKFQGLNARLSGVEGAEIIKGILA